jgi:hypothetical protein
MFIFSNIESVNFGRMNCICQYWITGFMLCEWNNKLTSRHEPISKDFLENIQKYNSIFKWVILVQIYNAGPWIQSDFQGTYVFFSTYNYELKILIVAYIRISILQIHWQIHQERPAKQHERHLMRHCDCYWVSGSSLDIV